jgi:cytidylate kinase
MSAAKRGGRFSYLRTDPEGTQTNPDEDAGKAREPDEGSFAAESTPTNDNRSAGGEGRSYATSTQELASVPKGKGRMKQERSQLNVRIPTMLKRQASAKAVLEGRDIGEVVAALLREYLDR